MWKFKNILILGVAMVATVMLFQGRASAAEYVVPEGTVYWESSYGGGTGRHATVSDENACTDMQAGKLSVKIDGYSILSEDGSIIESYFNNGRALEEVPPIHSGNRMMLHIWSEKGYRLGWMDAQDIKTETVSPSTITEVPYSGEREWIESVDSKEPEEIINIIQESLKEDESIPRKIYILGDFSGSMFEYNDDVMQKLNSYTGEKYVFGGKVEKFSSDRDLEDYDIDTSSTDIANAFNALSNVETDAHIYLLSDLQDNVGTELKTNKAFRGEITLVVYGTEYSYAPSRFIQRLRRAFPNATLTGF